ncbi:MAG: hypothetical protein JJ992_12705 [Planctomycetes bacterium]|nr:hypothetical protein [Planctomycetota bacterium]
MKEIVELNLRLHIFHYKGVPSMGLVIAISDRRGNRAIGKAVFCNPLVIAIDAIGVVIHRLYRAGNTKPNGKGSDVLPVGRVVLWIPEIDRRILILTRSRISDERWDFIVFWPEILTPVIKDDISQHADVPVSISLLVIRRIVSDAVSVFGQLLVAAILVCRNPASIAGGTRPIRFAVIIVVAPGVFPPTVRHYKVKVIATLDAAPVFLECGRIRTLDSNIVRLRQVRLDEFSCANGACGQPSLSWKSLSLEPAHELALMSPRETAEISIQDRGIRADLHPRRFAVEGLVGETDSRVQHGHDPSQGRLHDTAST